MNNRILIVGLILCVGVDNDPYLLDGLDDEFIKLGV